MTGAEPSDASTARRAVGEGTPSVREARARYFAANGFDERGYEDRWVRLQAGPLPIVFPNTRARVRAIRAHDVHHVVTGYATTWTGEAEIGAWEIASGCADQWAAWMLNLMALPIGLVRLLQAQATRQRVLYGFGCCAIGSSSASARNSRRNSSAPPTTAGADGSRRS